MIRVANARAARGDLAAGDRARNIAGKINSLATGRGILSAGWDIAWNLGFRGGISYGEAYRSGSEIMALFAEFYRLESAEERAEWVVGKYPRLVEQSKLVFGRLLRLLSGSGVLRDLVVVMREEVVEGGLVRDCLEVGAADLEGLVRVAGDLMFSSSSWSRSEL